MDEVIENIIKRWNNGVLEDWNGGGRVEDLILIKNTIELVFLHKVF